MGEGEREGGREKEGDGARETATDPGTEVGTEAEVGKVALVGAFRCCCEGGSAAAELPHEGAGEGQREGAREEAALDEQRDGGAEK